MTKPHIRILLISECRPASIGQSTEAFKASDPFSAITVHPSPTAVCSQTAVGNEVSPLVHSVAAPVYAEPAYLCIQVGKNLEALPNTEGGRPGGQAAPPWPVTVVRQCAEAHGCVRDVVRHSDFFSALSLPVIRQPGPIH